MNIGDRVDAAWFNAGNDLSRYKGPRGVITGVDGTHFIVRWNNGYEAAFPRGELRLPKPAWRHFKASQTRDEAIAA